MECFGFSPQWIQWISQCMSTVSYSIMLNGSPYGFFVPSRGLRQGDPLSPFLFIIGMEVLTRIIMREENRGSIHGVKISRNAPPVSHLLFADDLIIFSRANKFEATTIRSCLQKFSAWSGQTINEAKLAVHFSRNFRGLARDEVCATLNIQHSFNQNSHLGLPIFIHRSKRLAFNDIKERVLQKIEGWKAKVLSQAGRTALIKAVATAIPSYCMSSFLLPRTLCASLDASIKDFWWGFKEGKRRNFTPKSWE